MNESKYLSATQKLFWIGEGCRSFELLKKDIELLYQCIREIPELQFIIHSPVIKVSEKTRLFNEMFRSSFDPLTLKFISLVLKHAGRIPGRISRYFLDLMRTEQGVKPAEIVTAVPLDESLRQSI